MIDIKQAMSSQAQFDLGWMLQDGQVSDEALCQFLVKELAPELERLVARFFPSPADRLTLVDQVFLSVLERRQRYKSDVTGRAWLYAMLFDSCLQRAPDGSLAAVLGQRSLLERALQHMDCGLPASSHYSSLLASLDARQRLVAILHYAQNLGEDEIAVVLKVTAASIKTDLAQIQQRLTEHLYACRECSSQFSGPSGLEEGLRAVLRTTSPLMNSASVQNEDWVRSLLARRGQEKIKHQSQRIMRWGLEAGVLLFLLAALGWLSMNMGQVQSWFEHPTPVQTRQVASDLPAELTPSPAPTQAPSAQDKVAAQVRSLTQSSWSRWTSLWADVQVTTYPAESYWDGSGNLPGLTVRKQIWLSLPDSARVVSGPADGSPNITYAISHGAINGHNLLSGLNIQSTTSSLITDEDLQHLFSPIDMFPSGGNFTQLGTDSQAGRPALIVDWNYGGRRVYRYWIDQEFGVVLRRQVYSEGNFHPLVSDTQVTRIYFNASLAPAIYTSDQIKGDHFAYDFSGNPELPDYRTAVQFWNGEVSARPPSAPLSSISYNLSAASLSFQGVPAGWLQSPAGPGLEVYANQYDLGRLPLGGKTLLSCARSTDGKLIAYNSPPQEKTGDTALYVANLAALQAAHPVLMDGITAGDFAFSPDNRRLAFFGCQKSSGFCGLFVLDLLSEKLTPLMPLKYADFILWSPDSRSLALVGNLDRSGLRQKMSSANLMMSELVALARTWFFYVVEVDSGNATFAQPFDWSNLNAPPGSPTLQWKVPFKTASIGAKGCVLPAN